MLNRCSARFPPKSPALALFGTPFSWLTWQRLPGDRHTGPSSAPATTPTLIKHPLCQRSAIKFTANGLESNPKKLKETRRDSVFHHVEEKILRKPASSGA